MRREVFLTRMKKDTKQKLRYAIIGAVNTLLDFGLLFLFKNLGAPIPIANTASTGITFVLSFFANRNLAFTDHDRSKIVRQMLLFCAVTLFGLWVLQNGVIILLLPLLDPYLDHQPALGLAKLLATGVSMVWNYVLYSRVVFTRSAQSTD